MGTRGLTEVISGGKDVVVQYGQWDHYPEGQGMAVLLFLSTAGNINKLKNNLNLVYQISEEKLTSLIEGFKTNNAEPGFMSMDDHKTFSEAWPSLTRDTGAQILQVIADAAEPVPVQLDTEFRVDDVFCEGRYIINFDDNTFTSMFHGREVIYNLDNLPLPSDYLEAFSKKPTKV